MQSSRDKEAIRGVLGTELRGLAMNLPKTPFFVRYDERLVYPEPDRFHSENPATVQRQ